MTIYVAKLVDTSNSCRTVVFTEPFDALVVGGLCDGEGNFVYFDLQASLLATWARENQIQLEKFAIEADLDAVLAWINRIN